jgi:TonB family protein
MNKIFRTSLFIILAGLSLNVFSQNDPVTETKPQTKINKTEKPLKTKMISKGIINDRALFLVEPEYPESAKSLKLSGKVLIEVIIDEAGYVIEAKAIKGHPILRKASLEAAKDSKFAPFFIDKTPVKAKGIIVYVFSPNQLNWLEIGYYSPHTERIKRFLPDNFDDEKGLITKMNATDTDYDPNGYKNLVLAIENKLGNNEKHLWLFKLGIIINNLVNNESDKQTKTNTITKIQTHLYSKPEKISPNLNSTLEKLVSLSQTNTELFNKELSNLLNNLNIFGK